MASNSGEPAQTLQPGMIIAPQITIKTAERLVRDLYKLRVESIQELNSYDDKNYHVKVSPETDNQHIKEVCKHGYVLKVLNKLDSPKQHVAAEHMMARLLTKEGIVCPVPAVNIHGNELSLEKLPIEKETKDEPNQDEGYSVHLVRLMKFIPGVRLYDVPYTADLLIQAGELVGRIDKALQGFSHPALTDHDTIWCLSSLPRLTEFIHAVKDEKHKQCVLEVIDAFKKEVVPNYPKFQKGVIHGDFNEQNIIVDKCGDDNQNEDSYKITGVIDLGDSNEIYTVMEIAIGITYLMIESKIIDILDVGGYALHGYYKHMSLNEHEKDALRILIAGRYCQSLVMGAYSYMQDPGNEYLIITAKRGWTQLLQIWNTPKEKLYSCWQNVLDQLSQ